MKKTFSLILTAFVMALLPLNCSAQIEEFIQDGSGLEIVKQKNISTQSKGNTANFFTINPDAAQIALIKVDLTQMESDCGEEVPAKKAKKRPQYAYELLVCIPYAGNQQWGKGLDIDYKPNLALTLSGTENTPDFSQWFTYFDVRITEESPIKPDFYFKYETTTFEEGILGGIETEDFHRLNDDFNNSQFILDELFDTFSMTLDVESIGSEGLFVSIAEVGSDEAQNLFDKIDGITIQTDLKESGISMKQYAALLKIREYSKILANWTSQDNPMELYSIFNSMRSIMQKEGLHPGDCFNYFETSIKKEKEIEQKVLSEAQKGNPDALIWAARFTVNDFWQFGCNMANYLMEQQGNKFYDATYYYLTLALQGNKEASQELQTISTKYFSTEAWSHYQNWLENLKNLELISATTYDQQMQYIRTNIIGTGSYKQR